MGSVLNPIIILAILLSSSFAQDDFSNEVEGYLEPLRKVDVSTVETGIIRAIQVREGDVVSRGQVLVKLDRDVLEKTHDIAVQEAKSVANLKTAIAELDLKRKRLAKLSKIYDKGHGRVSELERAKSEVEVAQNRVLRAEEEIAVKQKELEQIEVKLAARNVLSPIDGIVIELHKNAGEAVSPNSPILITVVNIDRLKCVLNVPRHQAKTIVQNQSIQLESDARQKIAGEVQWKSPIVDAESETVKVVIHIENPKRMLTSGEHCILCAPDLVQSKNSSASNPVSFNKSRGLKNPGK